MGKILSKKYFENTNLKKTCQMMMMMIFEIKKLGYFANSILPNADLISSELHCLR